MTLGIVANLDKERVRELVPEVLKWLRGQGVDVLVDEVLAEHLGLPERACPRFRGRDMLGRCDMVLGFGGDGTILACARLVGDSGIPILGVKLGGLGFLAEVAPEELYSSLEDILAGHYTIVERMVLRARLHGSEDGEIFHGLNDFVLDKGAKSRVIRIRTFIDEEYLNTYIGDGLIVSTPTGSTAYSLAAGGPILLPSMEAIIINPISPHSLGARPVVIPGDKIIRVQVEPNTRGVIFSADGQVNQELRGGQAIDIARADYRIKLVSYQGRSFYDVLRAKLNWGDDVREEEASHHPGDQTEGHV